MVMNNLELRLSISFLLIQLCISFVFRTSTFNTHSTSISSSSSNTKLTAQAMSKSPVVLVAPDAGISNGYFNRLAHSMKSSIKQVNSPVELLESSQAQDLLIVAGQSVVSQLSTNDIAKISAQNKLIYTVFEDYLNDQNAVTRGQCLYDFYVPSRSSQLHNSFYATLTDEEYFDKLQKRLEALLDFLSSPPADIAKTDLDAGLWSQFLSLTYDTIDQALPNLATLRVGIDAFELRVDLLKDQSVDSVARQIALLRDACPQLPLVYTVRSKGQIGRFPDDPAAMFPLLKQGLRNAIEWLDIEACWPQSYQSELCELAVGAYARRSRLLGSLHVTQTGVPRDNVEQLFHQASLNGKADMLKVVTGAAGVVDCETIHLAGERVSQLLNKPYIGVCLGPNGSDSRVANRRFTPCTHPLMASAAPGQLTAEELFSQRIAKQLLKPKRYYLFGTPIQHSLSPAMHNIGLKTLGLPHVYGLDERVEAVNYIDRLRSDATFGGASVTIPHKETIMPLLDEVRGAAREICAVNTIVVEESEKNGSPRLVGYNTDWLGIRRPIAKLLSRTTATAATSKRGIGVVIGAGGTARAACYAVKDLGLDLVICNRSPEKAADLAEAFQGRVLPMEALWASSSSSDDLPTDCVRVIISTVPAIAQADWHLSPALLAHKPVVFDVVYRPARTPLLDQALAAGCPVVQGASMLLEQGLEQFQLWNKRRAPRLEMQSAVFNGIEKLSTIM